MIEEQTSTYLKYLPGIYQEIAAKEKVNFITQFLKVFETILSGVDDKIKVMDEFGNEKEVIGVEQILDNIHDYFDPLYTPGLSTGEQDFVSYLANWVALTLRQNWSEKRKRRLIADIVPLYKKRGTKEGLTHILQIYIGEGPQVTIEDIIPEIQVGFTSHIYAGVLRLGGYKPHFFAVKIVLIVEVVDIDSLREFENNVHDIVNFEKPAHTYYSLYYDTEQTKFPGIQVGISQKSEIGLTTLIFRS